MKFFKSKKLLSLLLTLVMVFGLLPAYQSAALADDTTAAAADETAATVSVTFSAANGDSFIVSPITVTVTDGLAEAYGYKVSTDDGEGNAITGPTYFDALIAVHEQIYGDAFTAETATNYLTIEDTGLLTKAFGQGNAFYSMQFVNCESCMSYCDQVQLADGDVLDYRVMQDTGYYSDYYTYFTNLPSAVYANVSTSLKLKGFSAVTVYGGTAVEIPGATISYRLADSDGEWTAVGTTDENGSIEITFPDEGDYDVIATGVYSNDTGDTPILAAWTDVSVKGAVWDSFAGNSENMAITEALTPTKAELGDVDEDDDVDAVDALCVLQAVVGLKTLTKTQNTAADVDGNSGVTANDALAILQKVVDLIDAFTGTVQAKWITEQLSVGYSGVSAPVIAKGAMYFQNASYLTKLDVETGKTLAQATLTNACGYAPAALAYGDGQIFVAENNGTIEAFDAETLALTWKYTDAIGGQALTSIYYKDGYVYTGFFKTDADYNKVAANYVCIEASAAEGAEKTAVWTYTGEGGYYWAGAYANENYVVFGGEAATGAETSKVTVLNRKTGEVVSETEVAGNVRSSVSYSEETGKLYFTSAAGYLYEAALSDDGVLTLTQTIALGGASTSTPVVHNNKAYVGVSGPSQFGTEGHTVKVIDLTTGTVNYEVPMDGYPQCTLLLSTAYEEETGKVYLYATENCGSGTVKLIVDSEGQTEAEVYDLYTTPDDQKNYCTASIVCDQDGTLYYINDSGCYFALAAKK